MAEPLPDREPQSFAGRIRRAEELTTQFQQHPNAAVREDVLELLQTIDEIHREAILRLVELILESGNHELIHRAAEDPRAGTLLQLYDVVPLPELVRWQEVLDNVREELRNGKADVELLRLTDGMAHLRLTGAFSGEEPALRLVVENAIVSALGPNQSVRWEPRSRPAAPPVLVSISSIQPAKSQRWVQVIEPGGLDLNVLLKLNVRRMELVVCRTPSGYHAFPNACPGSALPLHLGRISGDTLICPWHACAFELTTGKRVSGEGLDLKPLTLREESGFVEMAVWE